MGMTNSGCDDGWMVCWNTKHTGYVVLVWVTSSLLLRFLIERKSCVCGVLITFCSSRKTTISLIQMTICGDSIYLIDIFVGHDDYDEYDASDTHKHKVLLIRNVWIDFNLSEKTQMEGKQHGMKV